MPTRPAAANRIRVLALTLLGWFCGSIIALPQARARAPIYSVQVTYDILYNQGVGNNPELGDLYLPVGLPPGTTIPAVVVIHGGDWSTKSGHGKSYRDVRITAEALAEHGIAAFAIDYFLFDPRNPFVGAWPQNLVDIKTAIQWLRVNAATYGLIPGQFGVQGTSAGAHLAALAAMTSPDHGGYEPNAPYPGVSTSVQAAFVMYCPCVDISANGNPPHWLGFGASYQTQLDATPNTYMRPGLPPIMQVHGDADTTVPIAEAYEFQTELSVQGVLPGAGQVFWNNTAKLITYQTTPGLIVMEGLPHGFSIMDNGHKDGFIYDLRSNMEHMFEQYLPMGVSQD
jgi:acetyl esterase/lipase